jgi:hypothetical protein
MGILKFGNCVPHPEEREQRFQLIRFQGALLIKL